MSSLLWVWVMYSVTAGFLHSGAGQAHYSLFGVTNLCQSNLKVLTRSCTGFTFWKSIPRPMVKLPSNDRNFLSVIFMEATSFVFITKQTTLRQFNTKQVVWDWISVVCLVKVTVLCLHKREAGFKHCFGNSMMFVSTVTECTKDLVADVHPLYKVIVFLTQLQPCSYNLKISAVIWMVAYTYSIFPSLDFYCYTF